jgi:chemotaxis protein CheZ
MPGPVTLTDLFGPMLDELNLAMSRDDAVTFHATLESIRTVRSDELTRDLRVLAETLDDAMLRFRHEFRIPDLAEREVPDARARLNHVMTLTAEAAHRTMDLIERCGPLAERTTRGASNLAGLMRDTRGGQSAIHEDPLLDRVHDFLTTAADDCGKIREDLAEVMLAQTYQDLTGQIIRGVVALVGEVERVLEALMRMTGAPGPTLSGVGAAAKSASSFGPAIPGVSTGIVQRQADIDDLMAGLGI